MLHNESIVFDMAWINFKFNLVGKIQLMLLMSNMSPNKVCLCICEVSFFIS